MKVIIFVLMALAIVVLMFWFSWAAVYGVVKGTKWFLNEVREEFLFVWRE